jgi:hypothetical protein
MLFIYMEVIGVMHKHDISFVDKALRVANDRDTLVAINKELL